MRSSTACAPNISWPSATRTPSHVDRSWSRSGTSAPPVDAVEQQPATETQPDATDTEVVDAEPSKERVLLFSARGPLIIAFQLSIDGQPPGAALGTQAGPARIREIVSQAGFSRFRLAAQTPFNNVYEARP